MPPRENKKMADALTANKFLARLRALNSEDDLIGLKMGEIFKLGKEFSSMPVGEVEKLMESPIHKVRVGALSIMGQCAKGRNYTPERLAELYDLYIRRHDRINTWDLVDLAAY